MSLVALLVGFVVGAAVLAGLFVLLDTLAVGVEASAADGGDASPFSAPDEDAAIAGASTGFPSDLSWSFRTGGMFDRGWAAVKAHPVPLFVGGFLLTGLDACNNNNGGLSDVADVLEDIDTDSVGQLVFSLSADHLAQATPDAFNGAMVAAIAAAAVVVVGLVLVLSIVLSLIKAWLTNGWLAVHRDILVEGTSAPSTVFTTADRTLAIWLTRLLGGLLLAAVFVAAVLPAVFYGFAAGFMQMEESFPELLATGIVVLVLGGFSVVYAGLGVMLAPWFAVYDRSGPWTALLQSWRAASGNRVTLFVFGFVQALIILGAFILGMLMLCVGLLVTVPIARAITDLATSRAWLLARRGTDAPELKF
ncbi:MAG: hypothetical protein ACI8PZ_001311 [Myxococcota bacterium]|jgi:hypothetical protein